METLSALFLAPSAYALFSQKGSAWRATTFAHVFATAGILLGMVALAMARGPRTEANDIYHRVMLGLLILGLVLLSTRSARQALGWRLAA